MHLCKSKQLLTLCANYARWVCKVNCLLSNVRLYLLWLLPLSTRWVIHLYTSPLITCNSCFLLFLCCVSRTLIGQVSIFYRSCGNDPRGKLDLKWDLQALQGECHDPLYIKSWKPQLYCSVIKHCLEINYTMTLFYRKQN